MNIFESIASAIGSVLANKMRSMLTMLGIIIGIGSVIMITSVGDGVTAEADTQLSQLGLDALAVTVDNSDNDIGSSDQLRLRDADTIRLSKNVEYVSPVAAAIANYTPKNPNETKRAQITGTTYEHMYTQPTELLHGRFLTEADSENRSYICIVDSVMAKNIFGVEDVVGQSVELEFRNTSRSFVVVGVTKGIDYGAFYDIPASVIMPVSTLMSVYNLDYLDGFYVSLRDETLADTTVSEINTLLSASHGTEDKYSVQNLFSQADMLGEVMGYITTFIALVAGISLVVGGIGVMNIMLVTVTERTREIGIRKSLGATNGNIRFQFLVEAMILTMFGGIIGILVGYIGGYAVALFVDIVPRVDPSIILLTVSVSSFIGVVFGVYPADKAAKLDPIEALRYE